MLPAAAPRGPALVLLFSACLWGLSWWPLQKLAAAGVHGPALSLLAYGGVGLAGLPLLWRQRAHWRGKLRLLAGIALLGGWANASFIMALAEGDVVRVMLLFYLAPAWSVLGGRLLLGEALGRRRVLAVLLALAGAFLVIRAGGPLRGGGLGATDLLALSAGLAFAANNLANRMAEAIPIASKTVAMMLGCALSSVLALAVLHEGIAPVSAVVGAGILVFALVWVVLGTATTSYGVSHLEASRAGLILLAELVAALLSASLIQARTPAPLELLGALMILGAAAIDLFGLRKPGLHQPFA